MVPFFVVYRKQAIPYYAALLSHILIGDFFTATGVQLFWPLSSNWVGALNINTTSLANVIAELALFGLTLPIMYKLGDLQTLFKPHNKNWALIIPLVAVLGPLLVSGQDQEFNLPVLLAVPSLFYVGLFSYSILVELRAIRNKDVENQKPFNTAQDVHSSFAAKDDYCCNTCDVLNEIYEPPRQRPGQTNRLELILHSPSN